MGIASQDARVGLADHLLHPRHHGLQFAPQRLQHDLPADVGRLLDAVVDLRGEALGLSHHPAGCPQ